MVNGILYDADGHRVGYTGDRCPVACQTSPVKSVKQVRSVKSVRQVARVRPALTTGSGQQGLGDFLASGGR
jgi:hypothetical protein